MSPSRRRRDRFVVVYIKHAEEDRPSFPLHHLGVRRPEDLETFRADADADGETCSVGTVVP